MLDLDTALAQDVAAGGVAMRVAVVDAHDIRVDDHLGAHNARRGADKHDLSRQLRAGLDERVLLRMNTPARPRLSRVAPVGASSRVAVVADAKDLRQIAGCDHAADLQARACRPLRELFGHAHVDVCERDAIGRWIVLCQGFGTCHLSQINRLVYTHFPDYNAQHVAARTLVRPSPCRCTACDLGGGRVCLWQGKARRGAGPRRGRAAKPAGDRRPDPGVPGGGAAWAADPDPIGRRKAALPAYRTP